MFRVGFISPRSAAVRDAALLGFADAFTVLGERSLIVYADALPECLDACRPALSLGAHADAKAAWSDLLAPVHYLHADLALASRADLARLDALDARGADAAAASFWRGANRDGRHTAALVALPSGAPTGFAAAMLRACDAAIAPVSPEKADPAAFVYACLRENGRLGVLLTAAQGHATKEISDARDETALAFGPIVLDRVAPAQTPPALLDDAAFAPARDVFAALSRTLLARRI